MTGLRRRAAEAARWTTLATVATIALQLVQTAMLTRLLGPGAFGLVAMVNVIAGFVSALTDLGLGAAIIQRPQATQDQLSTLYWLNLWAGCAAAMLVVACTPIAVSFFGEPKVAEILPYTALLFVIVPIGQPFRLLLQKQLAFAPIAVIEMGSVAIGVAVAVVGAMAGAGVFALVWATLATAALRSAALVALGWRSSPPRLVFHWSETRDFLGFGLYQLGQRLVTYFNNRAEHLVIGAMLGPEALGLYTVAYGVAVTPAMRLNDTLRRVAFPVFAQAQDDVSRLRRGYVELVTANAAFFLPALLGVGAVAGCLMPTVFGSRFAATAPIVRYLAVVAALRSIANLTGSVLLARGRADWGFRWNAAITVTHLPAVFFGAHAGGLVGVAAAMAVAQIIYTTLNQRLVVRALIGSTGGEIVRVAGPVATSAAAMAATVTILDLAMAGRRGPWLLAAEIALGIAVYAALLGIFQRPRLRDLLRLLRGAPAAAPRAVCPPPG